MTLHNLGTVLRDLGERESARAAYEEALGLYWPLTQRLSQALGQNFMITLGNDVRVTEEAEDPW